MRVVGGQLRGRRLRVPPGKSTRPTTERVREALFNVLGSGVRGAAVLDLYAGSGALGIEALSRGAEHVVFVEMARTAADVIRHNLVSVALPNPDVARVVQRPIEKSLDAICALGPFNLCLVDPPFAAVRDGTALKTVEQVVLARILSPDCLLILESPSDQPNPTFVHLNCEQIRAYGDTRLAFLRPTGLNEHNDLGD
ncbi:MAG: 16S rRNA (guanine(966)-N(2))-methyltransferase RsmD [Sorangium cellulosum]|nr:MAG: 16S rRNA (guanine(966)-N(2))-methyltransferase RsmD [Sorangium cellulosum]